MTLLRQILESLKTPARLDAHPWTQSLTVQEFAGGDKSMADQSPGTQLVLSMGHLFRELMPATPPHDGKRLDTRWGRFGILAANYFAPLCFGRMYPSNLREAWRRIDQALLLFVYGRTADELTAEQVRAYLLIGNDGDFAANSTISDWHRDGVQALADLFLSHEKHLSLSLGKASVALGENLQAKREAPRPIGKRRRHGWTVTRALGLALLLGLTAALAAAAMKSWKMYRMAQSVKADLIQLNGLSVTSLDSPDLERAGPLLVQTHGDIEALRTEVGPWLWLGERLAWLPTYGGDLKYAGDLLEMATNATASAALAHQSSFPILRSIRENRTDLKGSELAGLLLYIQPALQQSQAELDHAMAVRQQIDVGQLSPDLASWLERADGYFAEMDQALSLAVALPRLLGASNEGPKTYLVLIQNSDELRPTGGFITAVGKLVVWDGQLISWDIVDSYTVDDMSKAYPSAPWQLQSFMNIPIMTFRDSNWFPDYPTTVKWAEYLYAYTNLYSVNGVIAVDQHVLKALLSVTGPLYVKDIDTTVNADNVEEVMRAQKVPPPAELRDPTWYRKRFLNPIAGAILTRILSGPGLSWQQLLGAMVAELDQRHILVQLDDPVASRLLAERGWDGSVARSRGDFLMVVDTNVGYNKTNAVVSSQLAYSIDLGTLSAPTANLRVLQRNNAAGSADPCDQRPASIDRSSLEYWYPIDRCYYDYLRVYVPAGSQLVDATPHAITENEMVMLGQDLPGRVDRLGENLAGLDGFGTLLMVPIGSTLQTDFQFSLPANVVQVGASGNEKTYQLRVQKQAGTVAIPITVQVRLPEGARIAWATPGGYMQSGETLSFDLDLTRDIIIRVQFEP